jgi:hypothetical protein
MRTRTNVAPKPIPRPRLSFREPVAGSLVAGSELVVGDVPAGEGGELVGSEALFETTGPTVTPIGVVDEISRSIIRPIGTMKEAPLLQHAKASLPHPQQNKGWGPELKSEL